MNTPEYMTVSEAIQFFADLETLGKGDYVITCSYGYFLAKKDEEAEIYDDVKAIDVGLHIGNMY